MKKRLVPVLIACAGSAALLYWLGRARPLWVDEEMLLLNVRDRRFTQLAGALWLDQSAPLGWLALERLALLLLGTAERALRLLSVLFGIGTLGTAVWIGRRSMTPLGAAILVALCAFGEWIVFFTLELKHYSADTFGALLLPALAVWAVEHADPAALSRRVTAWWIAAALGLWFSNGALFVAPGCALLLAVWSWQRGGAPAVARYLAGGVAWLASFAACDVLVLRHAIANTYLHNYWAFAFPPVSGGVSAVAAWLLGQFRPFAIKPASSGLWRSPSRTSCRRSSASRCGRCRRCMSGSRSAATRPCASLPRHATLAAGESRRPRLSRPALRPCRFPATSSTAA
jgi:hypothetical protein